jgi:hypothetical protein
MQNEKSKRVFRQDHFLARTEPYDRAIAFPSRDPSLPGLKDCSPQSAMLSSEYRRICEVARIGLTPRVAANTLRHRYPNR